MMSLARHLGHGDPAGLDGAPYLEADPEAGGPLGSTPRPPRGLARRPGLGREPDADRRCAAVPEPRRPRAPRRDRGSFASSPSRWARPGAGRPSAGLDLYEQHRTSPISPTRRPRSRPRPRDRRRHGRGAPRGRRSADRSWLLNRTTPAGAGAGRGVQPLVSDPDRIPADGLRGLGLRHRPGRPRPRGGRPTAAGAPR